MCGKRQCRGLDGNPAGVARLPVAACWQDLRRLFETTSLRWDAENAGGQTLIEVALERQPLDFLARVTCLRCLNVESNLS